VNNMLNSTLVHGLPAITIVVPMGCQAPNERRPERCRDVMSGHELEVTVTLVLDGTSYPGCGRRP
jgi:hypothetical protein